MSLPIEHLTQGKNEVIRNESNEVYHSDRSCVGSTQLRQMLKSPLSFYTKFTEDPLKRKKPSAALQLGSAVHCYILEPEVFATHYHALPDFGEMRSPKNREALADWKAKAPPGSFFLEAEDYGKVVEMGSSVARHPDAKAYLARGVAERSHYYRDPVTNIKCKIRPDFLSSKGVALIDLKTSEDCTEDQFMRSLWNYRYDFQLAMYGQGVKAVYGRDILKYVFIVIEKEPPFEVAVYELEPMAVERGLIDYRNCLNQLKECLSKNEWPAYQSSMQTINLPNWAY